MSVKMPHQLFINGEFLDAEGGKTYKTINPTDGLVRAENRHQANISSIIRSFRVQQDPDHKLLCHHS